MPSNNLRALYKTLYSKLFKNQNMYSKYYEMIYTFFKTTNISKDQLISDEEFYNCLIYKNLYSKKKICKFLLTNLENESSHEKLNTDNLSIEHILPQKENAIIWKNELGEDYEKTYKTYLHTLGNLTITGYNSELGTKSFNEKKIIIKEYSKANKLNQNALSEEIWNETSILNRARILAKDAVNIFKIEQSEIIDRKITSIENSYTLDDQDIITGTTPTSYTFLGETFNITSYSSMLKSLINTLYDLDESIMEDLSKNKFRFTNGERPNISNDKLDLRHANEIKNSGIYYESNFSSISILQFIKSLISKYDIDSDEFLFTCK